MKKMKRIKIKKAQVIKVEVEQEKQIHDEHH
jgi:hypothetical protein